MSMEFAHLVTLAWVGLPPHMGVGGASTGHPTTRGRLRPMRWLEVAGEGLGMARDGSRWLGMQWLGMAGATDFVITID